MSENIYNFRATEKKWKQFLSEYNLSNDELKRSKDKYYVLEMLPYPSGKIHMGHVRNYTIGDVIARHKKMLGFSVIHPMGWDSFGMPAENAALKEGGHPKHWTNSNIDDMKEQLKPLGFMYDWNREISTCSEEYYAQEQKIFLDMYDRGLIYKKKSFVNWDPVDHTVLANEQVIDGKGWRSGAQVVRKELSQWSLRITVYAEELLEGLKDLEGLWPEKVLKMQENWIGKSEGAIVNFQISGTDQMIKVFTTRPDTLYGATFVAISPDHPYAKECAEYNYELRDFLERCHSMSTTEADFAKAPKEGMFTGIFVNHPLIDFKYLPLYVANFVLMDYGTGAIFGCPAHDERDCDFAFKYGIRIVPVIESDEEILYTGDGKHINSEFLNGMYTEEAKAAMIAYLERQSIGKRRTSYRLRDWVISRQRYWGCPIPIIHCDSCGDVPAELPVLLPDDVKFDGKGNPLENHPTWKHVKCPRCGRDALRDTDTLDTFFESSWYYLRYLDPHFKEPINKETSNIAMPVDICIGGIEHAVLHLLYARFFMLVLRDMGYIDSSIPFKKLLTQGMVCHKTYKNSDGDWVYPDDIEKTEDGKLVDKDGKEVFEYSFEKMSKSKKNVVSPQKIIDLYGADAVRLFIISDTPPEKDFNWNVDALEGSWRYLNKVWKVFNKILNLSDNQNSSDDLLKITHVYLKKISESYETVSLNKTIALIRELFNEIESRLETASKESLTFAFESFIKVLSPITPYICHEMWDLWKKSKPIQDEPWPQVDEKLASVEDVTIAVQVNGKLRGTFAVAKDSDDDALKEKAMELVSDNLKCAIKKVIVVRNKIVNIVAGA